MPSMKTRLGRLPRRTNGRATLIRNVLSKRRRFRSRSSRTNSSVSKASKTIHDPLKRMLDLLIIGAGPAGITAAYEAKKAGLDYIVIEKGLIGNTVYQYPVGLTVFSTTNELEFREGDLKPAREKPTREELLSYYVRFVLDNELNVRTEEEVKLVGKIEF